MKKAYIRNYNNVLSDIIPFFEKTTNLLEADVYIGWNDVVNPDKKIIELCKEYDIPSIVMEHGMKAVSDYQSGLNEGGKPLIADHILVWGDKSKEIMIDAGIDSKRVHVVGAPIMWDHFYIYKSEDGDEREVPFNAGRTVVDPATNIKWTIDRTESRIPKNEKKNIIVFFPHHDWTEDARKRNKEVWDQIKDLPNVFIKSSSAYLQEHEENPFKEELAIEPASDRICKIMCMDGSHHSNIQFLKGVLSKSKLAITAMPGTINGLCWAMDVPILVPEMDFGWRDKKTDTPILDIWPSDYSSPLTDLKKKAEEIIENDTKKEDREKYANYFMGADKGNSMRNIIETIDKIIKDRRKNNV